MQDMVWLALGYNVPANPSKNRVYVWRRLKELGAGYFRPGVAILPKTNQSIAHFRTLAVKIREMGGDASLAELKFCDPPDEARVIQRFRTQSESEFGQLLKDCADIFDNIRKNLFPLPEHGEQVRRMMRRYGKARSRDYFMVAGPMGVSAVLSELVHDIGDLGQQMWNMLE